MIKFRLCWGNYLLHSSCCIMLLIGFPLSHTSWTTEGSTSAPCVTDHSNVKQQNDKIKWFPRRWKGFPWETGVHSSVWAICHKTYYWQTWPWDWNIHILFRGFNQWYAVHSDSHLLRAPLNLLFLVFNNEIRRKSMFVCVVDISLVLALGKGLR